MTLPLFETTISAPSFAKPRARRVTAEGKRRLEAALHRFNRLRRVASWMDIAVLYCQAVVSFAPASWLGEGLNATVEFEAAELFEVDACDLYWELHPRGPDGW